LYLIALLVVKCFIVSDVIFSLSKFAVIFQSSSEMLRPISGNSQSSFWMKLSDQLKLLGSSLGSIQPPLDQVVVLRFVIVKQVFDENPLSN